MSFLSIDQMRDLADEGRFTPHEGPKEGCPRCVQNRCHAHDYKDHGCEEAESAGGPDPDAQYQEYRDQAIDGRRIY